MISALKGILTENCVENRKQTPLVRLVKEHLSEEKSVY